MVKFVQLRFVDVCIKGRRRYKVNMVLYGPGFCFLFHTIDTNYRLSLLAISHILILYFSNKFVMIKISSNLPLLHRVNSVDCHGATKR